MRDWQRTIVAFSNNAVCVCVIYEKETKKGGKLKLNVEIACKQSRIYSLYADLSFNH
jgi:hypothetical protein